DRVRAEQGTRQESADEGTHDAKHDVPDHAEALVTTDEEAGEIAGDGAEHDPRNDAHQVTSVPSSVGCPSGDVGTLARTGADNDNARCISRCNRLKAVLGPRAVSPRSSRARQGASARSDPDHELQWPVPAQHLGARGGAPPA